MGNTEIILSAENISRDFKTSEAVLEVLKGINLEIGRSELVAVTGVSGVGKSTLLHILGGLDRPTGGEIIIDGIKISGKSDRDLAHFRNDRIGFVFQNHYLMEDFSALENVMMPLLIAGKNRNDAKNKGELLLEFVGLKDRQTHRPQQLSGGEQQRVAVARALANDPDVVLADEPSGNLDTATGAKLHDLLFRLNAESGVTFVIATHNRQLAENCHKELALTEGRIENITRPGKE